MTPSNGDQDRDQTPLAYYANYFEVGQNAYEFLIDMGQIEPRSGKFKLQSRFAVSPTHAKLFAQLLSNAVAVFEQENGQIPYVKDATDFELLLEPPPDFEHRAIDARRNSNRAKKHKARQNTPPTSNLTKER